HKKLEYQTRALGIYEELGEKAGIADTSNSIGLLYFSLGDYTQALEFINRALRIEVELGANWGIAKAAGNIGKIYYKLKQFAKALDNYHRALAIHQELGHRTDIAIVTTNIGVVYANKEYEGYDIAKAEEYYLEALTLLQELGTKHQMYECEFLLSQLYKQEKQWEQYAFHLEKYYSIKEEVVSEETKKKAEQFDRERKEMEREKQLAIERAEAESRQLILNNILPEKITQRLIQGENPISDHFDCVSILFMDIVDFTVLSSKISAQQLVHLLNAIFTSADAIMREFCLEKIKTIGDAYMAVAGAPVVQEDHALRAAQAALKLLDVMQNLVVTFPEELGDQSIFNSLPDIEVRIGLHCGPVAAGVVGENKFLYDLWGDAVNTASRMESHGEAGKIHVSEEFKNVLGETPYWFTSRGEIDIKGKGTMRTFFLERRG
ncbi:MAG: tetratricopeptide repeat protein, partial [Candidatus Kapabacteria bacterium]|nr:tetratricopeptide repeat protein [Candidatus Kapabacteria bacterium]